MRSKGQHYEAIAERYLQQRGLITVAKNEYCGHRELDLIMRDHEYWVFVEVKFRKTEQFGGAVMALSQPQRRRLRQAASYYLVKNHINEAGTPCRFDLVCITGEGSTAELQWFQNAF